jgi:hypothetical protein
MKIVWVAADQQLLKPFRTNGWDGVMTSEDTSGEYQIVATKSSTQPANRDVLYDFRISWESPESCNLL